MPTAMTISSYNSKYECPSVTVKTVFMFLFTLFHVKKLKNILKLFNFC